MSDYSKLTKINRDGSRYTVVESIKITKLSNSVVIIHTEEELPLLTGELIIQDVDPSIFTYLPVEELEHLSQMSNNRLYYATCKAEEALYGTEEGAGRRRIVEVFLQERELVKIKGRSIDSIIMDDF